MIFLKRKPTSPRSVLLRQALPANRLLGDHADNFDKVLRMTGNY
jgi:hypothetical protein